MSRQRPDIGAKEEGTATYRLSEQVISRSRGGNIIAAAAYRSGSLLTDWRSGEVFDFRRRGGVAESFVVAPEGAPSWVFDLETLVNKIDEREKRKDSQLARELQTSLPHELNAAQRRSLIAGFAQRSLAKRGMVASVNIHNPDRGGDKRNHHAHVLVTMRELADDGFGEKVTAWNPPFGKAKGKAYVADVSMLVELRKEWEQEVNAALERAGHAVRVDHRSLAEQGSDREPEPKQGRIATAMERKGRVSRAGDERRAVQARNEERQRQRERDQHRAAPDLAREVYAAVTSASAHDRVPPDVLRSLESAFGRSDSAETAGSSKGAQEQASDGREGVGHPDRERWRLFRERVLTEAYGRDMAASTLAAHWSIEKTEQGLVFKNADGHIEDLGDRVFTGAGSADEIEGLLDIAAAKGWEELEFLDSCSDDFKRRAMRRALERGFEIEARGADKETLASIKAELETIRSAAAEVVQRAEELRSDLAATAQDIEDLQVAQRKQFLERLQRSGSALESLIASASRGGDVNELRTAYAAVHGSLVDMADPDLGLKRGAAVAAQINKVEEALSPISSVVDKADRADEIDVPALAQQLLSEITSAQSTFTERNLRRALTHHTDLPSKIDEVVAAVKGIPGVVRVADRRVERFTTTELQAIERNLIDNVVALHADHRRAVPKRIVDRISKEKTLRNEQPGALVHLTGPERAVALVGLAGTGKSYTLGAARLCWEEENLTIYGAALAGKAASGLFEGSGIDAMTLAALELALTAEPGKEPRIRLGPDCVLVLDETGMVGSRQLARIIDIAIRDGVRKIVFVGDSEQLQPIEAGAPFRAIVERIGAYELLKVQRHKLEWQCEATTFFGKGRAFEGLSLYKEHGRIHGAESANEAKEALIDHWFADRIAHPDESQAILTHTKRDILDLNMRARAKLLSVGLIKDPARVMTDNGEREFGVGDRMYFLDNRRNGDGVEFETAHGKVKVFNGSVGTVLSVVGGKDPEFTVRLDGDAGHVVTFNLSNYSKIDWGFAYVNHKSQGDTLDRTYVYASSYFDLHLTYVGMSRQREDAHMYWAKEVFRNESQMMRVVCRCNRKDMTIDYERDLAGKGIGMASTPTTYLRTPAQLQTELGKVLETATNLRAAAPVGEQVRAEVAFEAVAAWHRDLTSALSLLEQAGVRAVHVDRHGTGFGEQLASVEGAIARAAQQVQEAEVKRADVEKAEVGEDFWRPATSIDQLQAQIDRIDWAARFSDDVSVRVGEAALIEVVHDGSLQLAERDEVRRLWDDRMSSSPTSALRDVFGEMKGRFDRGAARVQASAVQREPQLPRELVALDPTTIMEKANELLTRESYLERTVGLMVLCGRRPSEILKTGEVAIGLGQDDVVFAGQAKTRDAERAAQSYEVPVLGDRDAIVDAWAQLRAELRVPSKNAEVPICELSVAEINARVGKSLGVITHREFGVPPKALRSIYATIAHDRFAPDRGTFGYHAQILGHSAGDVKTVLSHAKYVVRGREAQALRALDAGRTETIANLRAEHATADERGRGYIVDRIAELESARFTAAGAQPAVRVALDELVKDLRQQMGELEFEVAREAAALAAAPAGAPRHPNIIVQEKLREAERSAASAGKLTRAEGDFIRSLRDVAAAGDPAAVAAVARVQQTRDERKRVAGEQLLALRAEVSDVAVLATLQAAYDREVPAYTASMERRREIADRVNALRAQREEVTQLVTQAKEQGVIAVDVGPGTSVTDRIDAIRSAVEREVEGPSLERAS